jgi:tRNA pseudouridine38-40 synthase
MRNIKLTIEYDGTDFFGFQRQPNGVPTIQLAIETALEKLFQRKVSIASASSRTDAGVHAECQIVHFRAVTELPLFRIVRALNHFLPESVSVMKAEEVSSDFHARFHAVGKVYEYRVWNDSSKSAIGRNFMHHEPVPLNLAAMKRAAKILVGKHDFRAFTSEERILKSRKVSRKKISFVRNLKAVSIAKKGRMVVFTFRADGFLYHMVRNLAGTLTAVGKGKLRVEDVRRILKSRDRKLAAETLPAKGLTLKKVVYPKL